MDAGVDALFAAPVACGTELPGVPMAANLVEGQPGYADELAALDLHAVVDPVDYSTESPLVQALVNYMLERDAGTSITHADALAKGNMGKAILGAAAKGGTKIDVQFLRRGLHYFYPCTRPVPIDLDTFKQRYGDYSSWQTMTVGCSKPKNGPRRLRTNEALGIFVAETIVDGGVRETEILFKNLRKDGQIDFAAYTHDGQLTDRSTFATASSSITLASPYTCMTCHNDSETRKFVELFPAGTGAGCRAGADAGADGGDGGS